MKFSKNYVSIVCDDVRQEQGDKISLMGVYQKQLIVPKLPIILPKLCFVVFVTSLKISVNEAIVTLKRPGSDDTSFPVIKVHGELKPDIDEAPDLRLILIMSPIDFQAEGDTFFELRLNNSKRPNHIHKVTIQTPPR